MYRSKTQTCPKCFFSDACDGIGNGYICELYAFLKSLFFNAFYSQRNVYGL